MTAAELWSLFRAASGVEDCEYEAWAFGADADALADLVARGEKTATSSAHALYALEGEPLPEEGTYDVILDSREQAVCVIHTDRVYVTAFDLVTPEHARREGEGDKSLDYWRSVHQAFFTDCLQQAGLSFAPDMQVVCEEFHVAYLPPAGR